MKTPALRRLALILAAGAAVLAIVSGILAARSVRRSPAAADDTPSHSAAAESEKPRERATPQASASPSPEINKDVQRALNDFIASQGGVWDIWYESLSTGAYAEAQSGHNAEPRSVAASVIKLFVMGAVYDAVQRGTLSHDTVYLDLKGMITMSDNDACNRLVRQLGSGDAAAGLAAVNKFAASLGCTGTQMNRLMLQNNGTENYITARDCALILRRIYEGECVSASASAEMLALLKAQTVNDRLPANLPQGVTVAHKTGNLSNLSCGDAGIIFTQRGDYLLCVLSNHSQNDVQTTGAIAVLSRTIYDVVAAQ